MKEAREMKDATELFHAQPLEVSIAMLLGVHTIF